MYPLLMDLRLMSINEKFSGITKDDLLECAAKNNIKNAARIIDEVRLAASMWPEITRECEVSQNMIEEILSNMVFFWLVRSIKLLAYVLLSLRIPSRRSLAMTVKFPFVISTYRFRKDGADQSPLRQKVYSVVWQRIDEKISDKRLQTTSCYLLHT